jgi:hypothetical protein
VLGYESRIPEASMDRSEALRRSVFSFANITSSLRFRRMGEGREEAAWDGEALRARPLCRRLHFSGEARGGEQEASRDAGVTAS